MKNTLFMTDVYKMGHMEQYHPSTTEVYSYYCSRSDKNYREAVSFGLQYYLKKYLAQPITREHAAEYLETRRHILGRPSAADVTAKINALADIGYWPLEIKALPEGLIVPVKNALFTIRSTVPGFHWAVGAVESLLLKAWYPQLVATNVHEYRKLIGDFFAMTVGNEDGIDFMVHDFGYRSDSSEESAAISGAAYLIAFRGSDTVVALPFIRDYYGEPNATAENWFPNGSPMASVPASEHSVMCSYGREGELQAYGRMLDLYPEGFVSIVSDTYNIWQVCDRFLPQLKDRILQRDGRTVIRPDSGNPPDIICGDPEKPEGSPERLGVLKLLDRHFGHKVNAKGYKTLNPKVGLIYGDGMYLQRYKNTLERMKDMRFAASNLVIGIGGIARQGTRDTLGNAIKATHIYRGDEAVEIFKDPITDAGKKSHRGLFHVYRDEDGVICTKDQATEADEQSSLLTTVYRNGRVTKSYSFSDVRANYSASRIG